jgi:hypothetical protein
MTCTTTTKLAFIDGQTDDPTWYVTYLMLRDLQVTITILPYHHQFVASGSWIDSSTAVATFARCKHLPTNYKNKNKIRWIGRQHKYKEGRRIRSYCWDFAYLRYQSTRDIVEDQHPWI